MSHITEEKNTNVTEGDLKDIAQLIEEGYTSGRIDKGGKHISWKIVTDAWVDG